MKILNNMKKTIPKALLCASKEATVFFLGLLTPLPKLRGRPSLWLGAGSVVLLVVVVVEVLNGIGRGVSDDSLITGLGESAHANCSTCVVLILPGDKVGDCMTRRGFGPDFLRAKNKLYLYI